MYDEKPTLTPLESKALEYIKATFEANGIEFSKAVRLRRRSQSYLTLISPNDDDFCRIKVGTRSVWFSVDAWMLNEEKTEDSRFDKVKDRYEQYWKVNLNCIEDFATNSDLILATYQSLNVSKRDFELVVPEEYEITEKPSTPSFENEIENSGQRNKGNRIFDDLENYTVIDLETTSKYPTRAEIIEMSAVRVRSGKIIAQYSQLVKPSAPISKVIENFTGITNEMVEHSPAIGIVLKNFINFIGDDIILGHNIAAYDSTILYDLCQQYGLREFNNKMLDTLWYSHYCDIEVSDYKLTTIAKYFGIEYQAHRALNDCTANFYVYEKLKERFRGFYIFTGRRKTAMTITGIKPEYTELKDKRVVLTGEFSSGKRSTIKSYLEERGAKVTGSVSSKTDYLIIGALGSSEWKYGDYGDKVAKAQALQKSGKSIVIIQESEFFEFESKEGESNG